MQLTNGLGKGARSEGNDCFPPDHLKLGYPPVIISPTYAVILDYQGRRRFFLEKIEGMTHFHAIMETAGDEEQIQKTEHPAPSAIGGIGQSVLGA